MAITINPTTCSTDSGSRTTAPRPLRPARPLSTPLDAPFTIIIDTAEQLPFAFTNLRADAIQLRRPLVVRTIRRRLPLPHPYHRLTIDYSIEGFETAVGIERKSHIDFCNTLAGRHRDRFEHKLSIINATFTYFAVVVEAEWSTILSSPPDFSAAVPKTLFRTVVAWQQRFPRVHWWFMRGRWLAEQTTFRVLERWWKDFGAKAETETIVGLKPSLEPSLESSS